MRALVVVLAVLSPAIAHAQLAAPLFVIERIEIEGADRVSAGVILSESRLEAGSAYSEQQLAEANDRLRRLPFVLDATFALQKGSERDRFVLVISVKEATPFFYSLDLLALRRSADRNLIRSSNGLVIGGRFFAGPRTGFHIGWLARTNNRPFAKNFSVFQAGITRYDVFGTGAIVTLAVNQTPLNSNEFMPEAVVAIPISAVQTATVSYTSTASSRQRERLAEARWTYDTTNHPFFPTRGTVLAVGPVVSIFDGQTRLVPDTPIVLRSRALAAEVEAKRYWEIGGAFSAGTEIVGGLATIDQELGEERSDYMQGYGEALVRVARELSADRASPSRLELTLRWSGSGSDRHDRDDEDVTELSVSWARRNAWGALRLGVGYAW